MDRFEVAAALRELAARLTASGADRYRVRAYQRAARSVEQLTGELVPERTRELPGIGDKLAAVIAELARQGTTPQLERLRAETSLPDAALSEAPMILGDALDHEKRLLAYLREGRGIARAEVAGELRRRLEVVARLDFVIAARRPETALARFARYPGAAKVLERGADSVTIQLPEGTPARALAVTPARFPLAWLRATGDEAHVTALERRARSRRVRLVAKSEPALYTKLGLTFVPPERRDDPRALAEARAKDAFADLIAIEDVQGYVHCHTHYSDGVASVATMAAEAKARGRTYITITDHSPTAHYAGGVEPGRLKKQWADIDRAEDELGIRILRGTESDILKDGALDYPDAILEKLDIVIASIHNRYKLDAKDMTRRIVRAMRHPCFKVWGHGLGRLLLRRPPVACDVEAILDALAESRGAIEVNGDPHRLDLEPRWLRAARERGIRFVLSTDAHAPHDLDFLETAVLMARRAGIRKDEVLNARGADEFAKLVKPF